MSSLPDDGMTFDRTTPVGDVLRRRRTYYQQTILDVERYVRIRPMFLEALEGGQFHKLPGRVYAIGFVRTYAEYLGLPPDRIVDMFKDQSGGNDRWKKKPELHYPSMASESRTPDRFMLIVAFVGLVATGIGWSVFGGGARVEPAPIPPVPAAMKTANVFPSALRPPVYTPLREALDAGLAARIAEKFAPVAAPPRSVSVVVMERSWLEIKDPQGKAVVSRVLGAGMSYAVPSGERGYTLSTGNAAAITIMIDGKPIPMLGKKGDIKRNIALDADILLPIKAKKK